MLRHHFQVLFLIVPYLQQFLIFLVSYIFIIKGFPGGSDGKESACNTEDPCSIPELGRSLGEGNGYPLQHSCLENPTDKGAWQASAHADTE